MSNTLTHNMVATDMRAEKKSAHFKEIRNHGIEKMSQM